jgi:isoleucyl-tRNA synthetase
MWPKVETGKIKLKLEQEFSHALKIIELGLAERDKAKIGLKWPLAKATITTEKPLSRELQEIISRQLNVKKIEIKKGKLKVELDTKMTEELELEGYAREISRNIQAERKKAGLVKENEIELVIVTGQNFANKIKMQEKYIKERVNARNIKITDKNDKKLKFSSMFSVKDRKFEVYFSKL